MTINHVFGIDYGFRFVQNLVSSPFAWSEDKASFGGLQATERKKELFKFQYMCNFRHLVILLSEQTGKHGRCQTYPWLWRNRKWNK